MNAQSSITGLIFQLSFKSCKGCTRALFSKGMAIVMVEGFPF